MALFLNQNEQRSQLQERIAAELQERARQKPSGDTPDGIEDSAYIKDTKQTTSLAWVWVLLVLATIGVLVYVITRINS
jgi:hypothetical protein